MGGWEINQDKMRIQIQISGSICGSKNLDYISCLILNKLNIANNFKRMN